MNVTIEWLQEDVTGRCYREILKRNVVVIWYRKPPEKLQKWKLPGDFAVIMEII